MWVFTLGSRVDETLDLYPTSKGMPSGLVMPLGARHGLHSARFASLSGLRVVQHNMVYAESFCSIGDP